MEGSATRLVYEEDVAIKRVGEDFSWLAETLADLVREMK